MAIGTEAAEVEVDETVAEVESSPTEEVTTTKEVKAETKGENKIPQSRFNEVNAALKETREREANLTTRLNESNESLVRLTELLEMKEHDVQTLNEIKGYVNDPEMEEHIRAIDNKLKGLDKEVKASGAAPDDALVKARELLTQTKNELLDTQADMQADALINRAEVIADKLLGALPKEYTDQDKQVVSALWSEKMDWEAATADPENLGGVLSLSFQEALNSFGTPRGGLLTQAELDEVKPTTESLTPEQELEQLMAGKDGKAWGATKTVKSASGKESVVPELSDDDFNKAMASIIRQAHGRK